MPSVTDQGEWERQVVASSRALMESVKNSIVVLQLAKAEMFTTAYPTPDGSAKTSRAGTDCELPDCSAGE